MSSSRRPAPSASTSAPGRISARKADSGPIDSFGQYLRELSGLAPLPQEVERELARQAQSGDDAARERLISHNLRFVISLARRYLSHGIPMADLVQDGNTGLIHAIESFDPEMGVPFVHYASYSIHQAIRHGIAHNKRQVRLPVNRAAELSRIQRAINEFTREGGVRATPEMIAEKTGIQQTTVDLLLRASQGEVSLDAPLPSARDGSATLAEKIGADTDIVAEVERESRDQFLERLLAHLPERDARILRMVFGMNGNREHTLEEVGDVLGITRERVRQLRERALGRLRSLPESAVLHALWHGDEEAHSFA